MDKCINFCEFMRYVFDEEKMVTQGAAIIKAMLEAQSLRLSNISEQMAGNSSSNYKFILRLSSLQVDAVTQAAAAAFAKLIYGSLRSFA